MWTVPGVDGYTCAILDLSAYICAPNQVIFTPLLMAGLLLSHTSLLTHELFMGFLTFAAHLELFKVDVTVLEKTHWRKHDRLSLRGRACKLLSCKERSERGSKQVHGRVGVHMGGWKRGW